MLAAPERGESSMRRRQGESDIAMRRLLACGGELPEHDEDPEISWQTATEH
jgi:hypothetical protein